MSIKPIKNFISNNNFINKHINKAVSDDAFAAKAIVTINVAKDVFAYATRFKTTMKNDKIPDKQRPFVAAMDLMSGAVTAIVQLAVGFSLANPKIQDKMWAKLTKGCTFQDATAARKGFGLIVALIGSTIIAERVIVPLIATPIAEIFEKKVLKHDGTQKTADEKEQNRIANNFNLSLNDYKTQTKTK